MDTNPTNHNNDSIDDPQQEAFSATTTRTTSENNVDNNVAIVEETAAATATTTRTTCTTDSSSADHTKEEQHRLADAILSLVASTSQAEQRTFSSNQIESSAIINSTTNNHFINEIATNEFTSPEPQNNNESIQNKHDSALEYKDQVRYRSNLGSLPVAEDEKREEEEKEEDRRQHEFLSSVEFIHNHNLRGMTGNPLEANNSAVAYSLAEGGDDVIPTVRTSPTHRIAITTAPSESDVPCVVARLVPGAERNGDDDEEESDQKKQQGASKEELEEMLAVMKKEERRFWLTIMIAAVCLNTLLISGVVVAAFCVSGSCGDRSPADPSPLTIAPSPSPSLSISTLWPTTFPPTRSFSPSFDGQTTSPTMAPYSSISTSVPTFFPLRLSGEVTIRLFHTPSDWTDLIQTDYIQACDRFWEENLMLYNLTVELISSSFFQAARRILFSGDYSSILETTLLAEGMPMAEDAQDLQALLITSVNQNRTGFIATIQNNDPVSGVFFEQVTDITAYRPDEVPLLPSPPPTMSPAVSPRNSDLTIGALVGIAIGAEVLICSGLYIYYRRWKKSRLVSFK